MCLIVFAWQAHPEYPLVIAANRDERHARPASPMHWWPERPGVLAGRDLEAGGSWFAVHASGRFAAVTNYREGPAETDAPRSRGELVSRFVTSAAGPSAFGAGIEAGLYRGFNLLAGAAHELVYVSNRGDEPRRLEPGVYGLSNASLDTPWPKLVRTRERLRELLEAGTVDTGTLIELLADRRTAPPDESVGDMTDPVLARAVTAPFIVNPAYGTRCTTALLMRANGRFDVAERRFEPTGEAAGESVFRFEADRAGVQAAGGEGG